MNVCFVYSAGHYSGVRLMRARSHPPIISEPLTLDNINVLIAGNSHIFRARCTNPVKVLFLLTKFVFFIYAKHLTKITELYIQHVLKGLVVIFTSQKMWSLKCNVYKFYWVQRKEKELKICLPPYSSMYVAPMLVMFIG